MKTFKLILLAACFLFMLPKTIQAQENDEFVMNLVEYTVKFGHSSNFEEGVKKWKKCYQENNGESKWNLWKREQGKGNTYVVSSRLANWAEMDEDDPAGAACTSVAVQFVRPHIENMEVNTVQSMPKLSRKADMGDATLVWVYSFDVKNSRAFLNIIEQITSTIQAQEGDKRGYWYRSLAGEGNDYFVSTPYKGFSDLDNDRDNVWEVYEKAHGKTKTEKIRDEFSAVLDNATSFIYSLQKDLSMQ